MNDEQLRQVEASLTVTRAQCDAALGEVRKLRTSLERDRPLIPGMQLEDGRIVSEFGIASKPAFGQAPLSDTQRATIKRVIKEILPAAFRCGAEYAGLDLERLEVLDRFEHGSHHFGWTLLSGATRRATEK